MLRTCEDLLSQAERAVRCLNGRSDAGSGFAGLFIVGGLVVVYARPNIADIAAAVLVLVYGIVPAAALVVGGMLEVIVWLGRRVWRRWPCRGCTGRIALYEWESMHPACLRAFLTRRGDNVEDALPKPDPSKLGPPLTGVLPTFYYVTVRGRSSDDRESISGEGATCLYVREDDALTEADDADWDAQRRASDGDPPMFFDVHEIDVDHLPAWATDVRDDVFQKQRLPADDPAGRRRVANEVALAGRIDGDRGRTVGSAGVGPHRRRDLATVADEQDEGMPRNEAEVDALLDAVFAAPPDSGGAEWLERIAPEAVAALRALPQPRPVRLSRPRPTHWRGSLEKWNRPAARLGQCDRCAAPACVRYRSGEERCVRCSVVWSRRRRAAHRCSRATTVRTCRPSHGRAGVRWATGRGRDLCERRFASRRDARRYRTGKHPAFSPAYFDRCPPT